MTTEVVETNLPISISNENKYIVIKMDCVNFDIEVLGSFFDYRDALKFFGLTITENKDIDNDYWYEKIMIDECTVSVYQRGIIFKKQLIYRYFIKQF